MTASNDKGRFAAAAPPSDGGGEAKPAAKDAAPRTRSKRAARIMGAFAAAAHSTASGERPKYSAQTDDSARAREPRLASAHGEAGGANPGAAVRPDLSPGPTLAGDKRGLPQRLSRRTEVESRAITCAM